MREKIFCGVECDSLPGSRSILLGVRRPCVKAEYNSGCYIEVKFAGIPGVIDSITSHLCNINAAHNAKGCANYQYLFSKILLGWPDNNDRNHKSVTISERMVVSITSEIQTSRYYSHPAASLKNTGQKKWGSPHYRAGRRSTELRCTKPSYIPFPEKGFPDVLSMP